MFACLAAQVHPLPLHPLDVGLAQHVGRVHLGHEHHILPCHPSGVSQPYSAQAAQATDLELTMVTIALGGPNQEKWDPQTK